MRVARVMAAMTILLAVAACGNMRRQPPKAMIARPGALSHGETLEYLGVDFSRCVFFDQYFTYDDVAKSKVQNWSRHTLDDISAKFPMPLDPDLTVSDKRNAKIPESAFKILAPDPGKWALNDSIVHDEIAPYVSKKNSGHGLLFVAEQLSKPIGVVAHYVVFDRKTGEIILLDQTTEEAGGFGIFQYYLSGLKGVAARAQKEITALVQ
jgi:hypothetical protein